MASAEQIAREVACTRRGAGIFPLAGRGLVEVTGEDRGRWLNGMVSNEVEGLGPDSPGCYALRLDRKGRILADLHVWKRDDRYWLEVAGAAVAGLIEDLDRFIIADDVRLADRTPGFERVGVEGPAAPQLVGALLGAGSELPDEGWAPGRWEGDEVVAAAFGWSGEPARQLFVPQGRGEEATRALLEAAERLGVEAGRGHAETLEVLRVEAGIPAWGAELDPDVFPDEARLGRAISTTKGCYTGQEIVARLRSRGQVNHLLVGLAFEGDTPAPVDSELHAGGRRTGEVTSSVISPSVGAVGLGYTRREHAEPGTALQWEGGSARVVALPMVDTAREAAGSRG